MVITSLDQINLVTAVLVPAAIFLFGGALGGALFWIGRRKRSAVNSIVEVPYKDLTPRLSSDGT
jgi:hypothetical protein